MKTDLQEVCMMLTNEFPDLIFWKHLNEGLDGSGDIDAIAPTEIADEIVEKISSIFAQFADTIAVFKCKHIKNVNAVFIISNLKFPRLLQIDITFMPLRFGMPWCDPIDLVDFTKYQNGIRVLEPGPECVVLFMLYGISYNGIPKFKVNDFNKIIYQYDETNCKRFINSVLPARIQENVHKSLNSIQISRLNKKFHANLLLLWLKLLFIAFIYNIRNLNNLFLFLSIRFSKLCYIRNIVHNCDRCVNDLSLTDFIYKMQSEEKVLYKRK
jgi:hypothetical protein